MEFFQFCAVNIDSRLIRTTSEILWGVAGDGKVQANANGNQKIRILQGEIGSPRGDRTRPPDVEGVITRYQIGCAPSGGSGNSKQLPELFKFTFGLRQTNTVSGKE